MSKKLNTDKRLSYNINDINKVKSLNIIKSLNTKIFKNKNDINNNKINFGFIAQELEQIDPNLVDTINYNCEFGLYDFKSVNHTKLHNLLIPTIQLLIKKVEDQDKQIKNLHSRLKRCEDDQLF